MGALVALLPSLVAALPGIITTVEALFGKGNGPAKLVSATQATQAVISNMGSAGVVPSGTTIDPTQLETIINTIVAQMNQSGALPKQPAAVVESSGFTFTFKGVTLNLT